MLKLSNLPNSAKGGLAAVVGAGVAIALGFAIPSEESGRKVEATISAEGKLQIRHVYGKQYLRAYLDIVKVPTACDGLTRVEGRAVRMGDQFTEAQCAMLLESELIVHAKGVISCSPGLQIMSNPTLERIREGPRFAAVSLAYNVGVSAYCRSTAARRFNAGDYGGGCTALTWFNRAGGAVNRGLTARRAREANICRNGLGALR